MNRVNKILKHKRYREYVRRNEKEEQNRQFCKHGMTHFLDVARIAWHLNVEENAGIDKELIYAAALLHDIGKPKVRMTDGEGIDHFHGHVEVSEQMAAGILRRLKFDNDTITKVQKYIRYHDYKPEPNARAVRRAVNKIGAEYFEQVMALWRADTLAQSSYERQQKLAHIDAVEQLYTEIMESNQCISLKTLEITGNDLIALGVPKGKQIGVLLNQLLEEVLQEPGHNTHEYLMQKAREIV